MKKNIVRKNRKKTYERMKNGKNLLKRKVVKIF